MLINTISNIRTEIHNRLRLSPLSALYSENNDDNNNNNINREKSLENKISEKFNIKLLCELKLHHHIKKIILRRKNDIAMSQGTFQLDRY